MQTLWECAIRNTGESERGYGFGEALFTRMAALSLAQYGMKHVSVLKGILGDY